MKTNEPDFRSSPAGRRRSQEENKGDLSPNAGFPNRLCDANQTLIGFKQDGTVLFQPNTVISVPSPSHQRFKRGFRVK